MDRRALNSEVQRLSIIDPWRALTALIIQWIVIAAATAAAIRSPRPIVIIVALCVIATRQHALAILMHDGSHFRLLHDRSLNDVISNLMAGLWLGIVTSLYRDSHLRHHQHPTTLNDPDWVLQADLIDWHWPKTPKDALIVLLVDLTGVNFVKMFIVFF